MTENQFKLYVLRLLLIIYSRIIALGIGMPYPPREAETALINEINEHFST